MSSAFRARARRPSLAPRPARALDAVYAAARCRSGPTTARRRSWRRGSRSSVSSSSTRSRRRHAPAPAAFRSHARLDGASLARLETRGRSGTGAGPRRRAGTGLIPLVKSPAFPSFPKSSWAGGRGTVAVAARLSSQQRSAPCPTLPPRNRSSSRIRTTSARPRRPAAPAWARLGEIAVSSNIASFDEAWAENRISFQVGALGQIVAGNLEVLEDSVRVEIALPWNLRVIADKARGFIQKTGPAPAREEVGPEPPLAMRRCPPSRSFRWPYRPRQPRPPGPARPPGPRRPHRALALVALALTGYLVWVGSTSPTVRPWTPPANPRPATRKAIRAQSAIPARPGRRSRSASPSPVRATAFADFSERRPSSSRTGRASTMEAGRIPSPGGRGGASFVTQGTRPRAEIVRSRPSGEMCASASPASGEWRWSPLVRIVVRSDFSP